MTKIEKQLDALPKLSKRKAPVYLDYQATTPTDPRVVDAMLPFFSEKFGNPASTDHFYGWEADEAVEAARGQVADLIGAEPREIIFTSGATESNNLALQGAARFYGAKKTHIITASTEHKCVLETCRYLENEGFQVTYLAPGPGGLIDLQDLKGAIRTDTLLVSIMAVHNEIGVVQPISEIGAICREQGVFFHTDGAQAVGKVPVDVNAMQIDLLSLSGHKVYGPMGVGALYVRRRPRVRLAPIFQGGGQERGLRSGTLPVPLCVGLGVACEIAGREMGAEAERLRMLRDRLYGAITQRLPDAILNGDLDQRIAGNLNFSFPGLHGESPLPGLKGVSVSSGSACTSTSVEPSYVLRALGQSGELAASSVRFGLGRFTTEEDIDIAADKIISGIERLRAALDIGASAENNVDPPAQRPDS